MPFEFRCADAGAESCSGHLKADSEGELLQEVEQHLREKHNVQDVSETLKKYAASVATQTSPD